MHAVTRAANTVGRDGDVFRSDRGGMATAAVLSSATFFCVFFVGLVADRTIKEIAVDHLVGDVDGGKGLGKTWAAHLEFSPTMATRTVFPRCFGSLGNLGQEVVAIKAGDLLHALFEDGVICVALLADIFVREKVVRLDAVMALDTLDLGVVQNVDFVTQGLSNRDLCLGIVEMAEVALGPVNPGVGSC